MTVEMRVCVACREPRLVSELLAFRPVSATWQDRSVGLVCRPGLELRWGTGRCFRTAVGGAWKHAIARAEAVL